MRVGSFAVARPSYYDRNATTSIASYGGDTAPHAPTTRFTTTIAAGKKMLVEVTEVYTFTTTAPVTAGRGYSQIQVTSGGNVVCIGRIDQIQSATVNALSNLVLPQSVTVYAGETVTGSTYNGSIGGTLFHNVAYKATMYDA